jgi:hypothetical protein
MLLLLLLRRALLASSGSCGCSPLALANTLSISVRLITPLNLPDKLAPGIADADIEGATAPVNCGGVDERPEAGSGAIGEGGTRTAGVAAGVGGPEEAGEGVSTTHMR